MAEAGPAQQQQQQQARRLRHGQLGTNSRVSSDKGRSAWWYSTGVSVLMPWTMVNESLLRHETTLKVAMRLSDGT